MRISKWFCPRCLPKFVGGVLRGQMLAKQQTSEFTYLWYCPGCRGERRDRAKASLDAMMAAFRAQQMRPMRLDPSSHNGGFGDHVWRSERVLAMLPVRSRADARRGLKLRGARKIGENRTRAV